MTANRSLIDLSTKPKQYFGQTRPEMERFVPSNARRILDVGCGEAGFGSRLKENSEQRFGGSSLFPTWRKLLALGWIGSYAAT